MQLAAQVLSDRSLKQWRTAAVTQPALSGGPDTLDVPWMKSESGADADVTHWSPTNVARLALPLRDPRPQRLIIVGPVGSGKTTLAGLVMAELLKQAGTAGRIPVFLPISAWNPKRELLCDWMERRIGDESPELHDKSSYGPTAPQGLVERRMILPILDGLDVLPKELRWSMLSGSDFRMHDQVVVTCREKEFHEVSDACPTKRTIIVRPGRVSSKEVARYLRQVTDEPSRWNDLLNELENTPRLAEVLSQPRNIYLARTVYHDDMNTIHHNGMGGGPGELIEVEKESGPAGVEHHLLMRLIPALILARSERADGYSMYGTRALGWLAFLNRRVPGRAEGEIGDIAWWQLYKAVPPLSRLLVPLRALLYSGAGWLAVALLMPGRYGRLTGLAYASAIAAACLFLAQPRSPDDSDIPDGSSARHAWRWRARRVFSRSRPFLAAGVFTFLGYGFFIGLRVALTGNPGEGARAGAADGLVASLVVVLAAVIAGIPTPPREESLAKADSTIRPKTTPVTVALSLGAPFGLLAGILAVIKHQSTSGPSVRQGLIYGLVMGLDFAVGTWLVRRTDAHLAPENSPDPPSGLRAERMVALLVPVILGLTFASAFGLSAELHWSPVSGIANGLVGFIVGSLASDWPIYVLTVGILAVTKQLPFRVMKFLEYCDSKGIIRAVPLQSYQFREDPDQIGLTARSSKPEKPHTSDGNYTLTELVN